jgi:hypothetical protein
MRRLALFASALAVLSALLSCDRMPEPKGEPSLESLNDVDSLTVLIHFENSGVGIGRGTLEQVVIEALHNAGVGLSQDAPPYLHVRVYARAEAATVSDRDTPRGPPTSWHFGIWVDQNRDYPRESGPLTNICPLEAGLWSRGGTGPIAEGRLPDSVRTWLAEFVEDYQAANTDG